MSLSKEDREERLKRRKSEYYSLSHDLYNIKRKLRGIEKNKGHTTAFKQLILGIEGYEQQISDDFSRYEKQIRIMDRTDEIAKMQKALNRERAIRQELELKIKEASESSGLFIKFVRNKLGV